MTLDGRESASQPARPNRDRTRADWHFLSNHGHVLVCIALDPDTRLRDISSRVGITERAVFGIVEDLERGGIIQRLKVGRRNRYLVNVDQHLRHEIVAHRTVGDLLGLVAFSSSDDFDALGAEG
jgi:DNA-binding MarR family transcriptional regulator